ncbi:MAG: energy transducer TonB [Paludibacteraceae bacterium]|nr:energy transducer TonB [Paludibacteraceae bacterium]
MRRLFSHIIGIILAVIANSCVDSNTNRPEEAPHTSTPISGKIYDENGNVLSEATVLNGDSQATTDSSGHFNINVDTIIGNRYVLRIKKDGYFDRIYSKMVSDTMNYPIQLIKKEPSKFVILKKFNANEGVIIEVNGATVTIPESSLAKNDGSDYNGTVDISVVYLSPTESPAMEPLMPGADLMAIANDGDTVPLISYGMVNVEMSDEDGNPLQLKNGCEAYLKYPAPKGFTSHDTIPLWYFNEESGLWVEEGYTTRQGDEYVGSVRHFTWWNCDIKLINGAMIRCRLINYPYHSVCICSAPDTISTSVVNETCTSNIFPNRPFSIAGVKMRSLKPGEFLDTTICVNRFVFQDINGNTLKSVKFKINDVLYYSNGENPIFVPIDKNEKTTIRFQKYETKTITKDDFNSENVCVIVCKPLEKKNTSPSLISNVATESNKGSAQNATTEVNNEIDEEWDNNDTTVYEGTRLEINPLLENQSYYTSILRKNIKYPITCMETGIQGRVFVEFIIEKDGSVSNVRVANSVQLKVGSNQKIDNKSKDFELLEQEAVRVVKLFKGLQPGIKNGNIVRTKQLIPVTFKLN